MSAPVTRSEVLIVAPILAGSLKDERSIRAWLTSKNRYLGGAAPIDLIREGYPHRVREAAEAFKDGSYL